jgi:hypothetical protein
LAQAAFLLYTVSSLRLLRGAGVAGTLVVRPLALGRLLLERFPAASFKLAAYIDNWRQHDSHPALDHLIDELVLALGDLDNLLNQACAELALKVRDAGVALALGIPSDWDWGLRTPQWCTGARART